MNALRWIAGFFGFWAVLGVMWIIALALGYVLAIISTCSIALLGIDILRVLLIAGCCLFVLLAVAIGVRSNLYHIKRFFKKMVDAFMRI